MKLGFTIFLAYMYQLAGQDSTGPPWFFRRAGASCIRKSSDRRRAKKPWGSMNIQFATSAAAGVSRRASDRAARTRNCLYKNLKDLVRRLRRAAETHCVVRATKLIVPQRYDGIDAPWARRGRK